MVCSHFPRNRRITMARGSKAKYTSKQKRKAEHIEEGYEKRGASSKEAASRAWATVNKESGGGKKSGSGRGKQENRSSSKKGGKKGGKKAGKKKATNKSTTKGGTKKSAKKGRKKSSKKSSKK